MKSIEDIERMSPEALEKVADDLSIKVPDTISLLAENAVLAASGTETVRHERRRFMYIIGPAVTALAASLAVILCIPRHPKDTFDDPRMAYAEVERALNLISSKMDKGLEIASEAEPVIEKTTIVFTKSDDK